MQCSRSSNLEIECPTFSKEVLPFFGNFANKRHIVYYEASLRTSNMLLRFGVTNLWSIRDRTEVSLIASSLKESPSHARYSLGDKRILPITAIFGANASGKSNVLFSLLRMREIVVKSHEMSSRKARLPYSPFVLDEISIRRPTGLNCDLSLNGVRYHYGFEFNRERILKEWLFAFPKGKKQLWFNRVQNRYEFGKSLKGNKDAIRSLTNERALFLSAAGVTQNKQLVPIFDFFSSYILDADDANLKDPVFVERYILDKAVHPAILKFLSHADLGISDVRAEFSSVDKKVLSDMMNVFKKHAPGEFDKIDLSDPKVVKQIELGHKGAAKTKYIAQGLESRGTLKLLELLGLVFDALKKGRLIVVDELDTSLHPLLAIRLLNLFASSKTNKRGAQILFTSHDTNLLSAKIFRRDEVWFAEKDKFGATHITPLSDIKTRRRDNFERGYLEGRYGAIPILGSLDFLEF